MLLILFNSGLCKLKNKDGAIPSKSYNVSLLQPYQESNEAEEHVPDEKQPVSREDISISKDGENSDKASTGVSWDIFPDEILEMIVLKTISGAEISTYNTVSGGYEEVDHKGW